jgi:two-component system, sensor histidine kinase
MREISPYYIQKPFEIQSVVDLVYQLLGHREYPAPDFRSSFANYDNDKARINQMLTLLHKEFEDYLARLTHHKSPLSAKEWSSIAHKLITHTRNLNLGELTSLLEKQEAVPADQVVARICNVLAYCLCCIRVELRINSAS